MNQRYGPEEVTTIRREAEASYRGPFWIRWAVASTLVVSAVMIYFGIAGFPILVAPAPSHYPAVSAVEQPAVGSLPLTVAARFTLHAIPARTHIAVANRHVYLGVLQGARRRRPSLSISAASFTSSGATLEGAQKSVGKIELIPPGARPASRATPASSSWSVAHWQMWVTGGWVVALVQWSAPPSAVPQYQLYALSLPTGQYGLFRTAQMANGAQSLMVAVGDGRVLLTMQAGRPQSVQQSVPLEIDTLGGANPLAPVRNTQEVMVQVAPQNPAVVDGFAVFHSTPTIRNNTIRMDWYRLSWDGTVRLLGQSTLGTVDATAAMGASGILYTVESLPSVTQLGMQVVRVAPLAQATGASAPESWALPSAVRWIGTDGAALVWVQRLDHKWALVVGELT